MKNAARSWMRSSRGAPSMADDVILAKAEIIERCLQRVQDSLRRRCCEAADRFHGQDSILLNLERACQAAIDLALHLVRVRRLGLPKESREAFELLEQAGLLPSEMAASLRAMVGFRNVAVHNYRDLDLEVVRSIVETKMLVLKEFSRKSLQDFHS